MECVAAAGAGGEEPPKGETGKEVRGDGETPKERPVNKQSPTGSSGAAAGGRGTSPVEAMQLRVPAQAAGSFLSCTSVPSVLSRLWDARLLTPLDPSVLRMHGPAPVRAGLFGVVKKGSDRLRVIVDRRRQNALEIPIVEALRSQCSLV